jgi:drug/metabolite transporter (DMT)-like permease
MFKKLSLHTKANVCLGISIIALSFSGFYVRWADAPGPITSLFRMAFSALLLTFYVRRKRSFRSFTKKQLIFPLLAGVFSALDHNFWSSALQYTTVANAILFNYIAPIWVACVAYFLYKEKLTRKFMLGLGLTMLGTLAIFGSDLIHHPQIGWGDSLAILSSFFYAGYFLFSQQGRKENRVIEYLWLVTLSATFTLTLLAFINGYPLSGYSGKTILIFIAAAVFAQLIGYLALSYASGHLPASIISPTMILQPVLTALLAVPISSEPITLQLVIAAPLVLIGVYLINHNHT